ncbi:helix-turn-helix domain-containing protein [Azospirillum sp. TSO22-1]|uniref:helix-turn-helix transcriptional regulator n=1 Tax=Azospirillum sp. TSO22-1 TaxID=716789 RepID=UPI001FFEAB76|nr:helix-turn-helix domain-containing protein [Azospirillum sp. TSO22-1]
MTDMTDAAVTAASTTSGGTMEGLLTPESAAILLGVAPATLEAWRRQGTGPVFVKLGTRMVRYRRVDVEAFIAAKLFQNTVQARQQPMAAPTSAVFDKKRRLFVRRPAATEDGAQ